MKRLLIFIFFFGFYINTQSQNEIYYVNITNSKGNQINDVQISIIDSLKNISYISRTDLYGFASFEKFVNIKTITFHKLGYEKYIHQIYFQQKDTIQIMLIDKIYQLPNIILNKSNNQYYYDCEGFPMQEIFIESKSIINEKGEIFDHIDTNIFYYVCPLAKPTIEFQDFYNKIEKSIDFNKFRKINYDFVEIVFDINQNGKIENLDSIGIKNKYKDVVLKIFTNICDWKPANWMNKSINSRYKIKILF